VPPPRVTVSSSHRPLLVVGVMLALAAPAVALGLLRSSPHRYPHRSIADEPKTIVAAFTRRDYGPGETATLRVVAPLRRLSVQLGHTGPERRWSRRTDLMTGLPVARRLSLSWSPRKRLIRVRVGNWPSGLYYARLDGPGGWLGFAPFIVRPRVLGLARVAVVMPTNTWQAYNFRDMNHDGVGDTWYADPAVHSIDLTRAYLDRGVPPGYRGIVHWLSRAGKRVDYLSDSNLENLSSRELAQLYDLVVFAGHEEYVTPHVYDLVQGYRNLGGNLIFLSANTFWYRVEIHGQTMIGRKRWIDLGRPQAPWLGVQYVDWNRDRFGNKRYVVAGARKAPWFFRGTGLRDGSLLGTGRFGIEIDARTRQSPPGVQVLARIPDIFGRGETAEMAYYESPRGAKIFSAGTLNFSGAAPYPPYSRLLENLWARLSRP
jgi:hypothetical protein